MKSTNTTGDERRFCVVIHDVTPVFAAEIDSILDQLNPLLGKDVSAAVVPCWHGRQPTTDDIRQLQDWGERFGELLLHGWTHYRQHRPGLISYLTGHADEFAGMSPIETRRCLEQAQTQIKSILGVSLRGFVPPAWQFPGQLADIQSTGIDYILGFQRLRSTHGESIPLATWSWDWGWLYGTSLAGAWLGSAKRACYPAAMPVIVLHPIDLHRSCVPHAIRLIERFLQRGWKPILPSELVRRVSVGVPG